MVNFVDHSPDAKDHNGEVAELSTHGNDADQEVNGNRNVGSIEVRGSRKRGRTRTDG
jgi:hypothetical protein